jgi:lysophospholipase L1-like esterase
METSSPRSQVVATGGESFSAPTVTIRDRDHQPLAGRRVRFTLRGISVAASDTIVTTDARGRAALPRRRITAVGRAVVEARLGHANLAQFTIDALPGALLTGPTADRCPLLDSVAPDFTGITHTVALLRDRKPVTIVALGSSSTFGTGASDSSLSYPSQTARELQRAFPGSAISLINAGIPGNVAKDLDARLDRDVIAYSPDLVILQTGTNDALQKLPLPSVLAVTEHTISTLRDHDADVVLLDSQRFKGGEKAVFVNYLNAISALAQQLGVPVSRRYGWMSAVLAAKRYSYKELITGDGLHQTDLASECTAHLITTGIAVAYYSGRH